MAATEFLARPQLDQDTARSYNQPLARLCRALGDDRPVGGVTPEQVAGVFAAVWGTAAARTWNRHRVAMLAGPSPRSSVSPHGIWSQPGDDR